MSSANAANLVIGAAVLALMLYRQLITRKLGENYRLSVVLAVIGVAQFATFLKGHPHGDGKVAMAVIGSLMIAGVFGAGRALTVRVWRADGGQPLRKGTWLTAVLWIAGLAAHLGFDYLVAGHVNGTNGGNVGDATIVLYLVVTLTIQQYVLLARVRREEAAGRVPAPEGS